MQQVARYEGIVNRVSGLNLSCYEELGKSRTEVESFVQQVARYEGIVNHVSMLIHSCNKLHATRES